MGNTICPGHLVAGGKKKKKKNQRNTERLRSKWTQHATAEEFRESLVAHASFRHPSFLFQEHSGKKVNHYLYFKVE
jgi:hypothetical protein